MLSLVITYSETYPDELPEIAIEAEEGELSEEEEETLVMGLIGAVSPSHSSQYHLTDARLYRRTTRSEW